MLKRRIDMSKIAIVYQSNYGYTERYVDWLAEELDADVFLSDQVEQEELSKYSVLIVGGGMYAGGWKGQSVVQKHYEKLKDKEWHVFTVGLSDVKNEKNIQKIRSNLLNNWSKEMKDTIHVYHFRGGIDYPNLRFFHRLLMSMLMFTVKRKKKGTLDEETKEMIATYGTKVDFTDRGMLTPLIEELHP